MKIESIKISDLKLYSKNAKRHPESQIEGIAESIKRFGFRQPVVIDSKNEIVVGHGRVMAAKSLGLEEVPCERLENLSARDIKAYRLIDNRIAESGWIPENLAEDLKDIEYDFGAFNVDMSDLLPPPEIVEDEVLEVQQETTTKRGDIFQCGSHRIMCGDSTSEDDVNRLMDGLVTYSVLSDPPYNIGFNYSEIEDNLSDEEYKLFCEKWFGFANERAERLVFTPGPRNEFNYPKPKDKGVWIKRNATAGASVFHLRCAEPILFYGKFKRKRNTDVFEYSSGFADELKDAQRTSGVAAFHAPAKAMKLWVDLLGMFEKSDIIYDPFVGNGTTLIAAEQLGRVCYGMEISPQYVDVTIKRWENFTGKQAIKE
jgi:site-specific DNA-methyltransferase (adenine-specific)